MYPQPNETHAQYRRRKVCTVMANLSLLLRDVYRELEDTPNDILKGLTYERSKIEGRETPINHGS